MVSYYLPSNCVYVSIYRVFSMGYVSGLLKSNDLHNLGKKLKAAIYSKKKNQGCPQPAVLWPRRGARCRRVPRGEASRAPGPRRGPEPPPERPAAGAGGPAPVPQQLGTQSPGGRGSLWRPRRAGGRAERSGGVQAHCPRWRGRLTARPSLGRGKRQKGAALWVRGLPLPSAVTPYITRRMHSFLPSAET